MLTLATLTHAPASNPEGSSSWAGHDDVTSAYPDGLGGVVREADFEYERALVAARRGLFGARSAELPMIGRYRVKRKLGAGGMGEVYLAFDPELEREVAIKLVRAELSLASAGDRLRVEAKALGRLSHPNVVQVHDTGEHRGRTFIAMEYVRGQTLQDWLRHGRHTWREILACFVAAGRGLEAAHEAGIVHRDFKPANVLLTEQDRVCVADFGLALTCVTLALEQAETEETRLDADDRLTMTGTVLGTLRYMPLEQLAGIEVDHRADQFAFCVALYEALWDSVPFASGSFEQRQMALAAHAIRRPRGGGPRALWKVIERGLARDPDARWPDMGALLAALEAIPRRRRRFTAAGLGLPLMVGLVSAAALHEAELPPDPCADAGASLALQWASAGEDQLRASFAAVGLPLAESSATAAIDALDEWRHGWGRARVQLCRETVAQTLPDELAGLRGACLERARLGFEATLELLLDADPEVVRRAPTLVAELPELGLCEDDQTLLLGQQPAPSAARAEIEAVERELASIHVALVAGRGASLEPRLDALAVQVEALDYAPLEAGLLYERGQWALRMGRREAGIAALREAVDIAEASRDDRHLASAWLALALYAGVELGDSRRAEAWLRRARASHERIGLRPRVASMLEFGEAKLSEAQGDLSAAELGLRAAIAGLDDDALSEDRRTQLLRPSYLGHLAGLLARMPAPDPQRAREQVELRRAALAAAERCLPAGHPRIAAHAFNLGQVLLTHGNRAEAQPLLERAAHTWLDSGELPDPQLGAALLTLAQLELEAGELERAQQHAREAELVLTGGESSIERFNAAMSLAVITHMRGELESALAAYERSMGLLVELPDTDPDGDPQLALLRANAGACALELERYEHARASFELAATLATPGPHTVVAGLGLAQLELRAGQLDAAATTLVELESARASMDAGDQLELALLRAIAALRRGRAAPSLSVDLHSAIADPDHNHHRRLAVALRSVALTDRERQQLALGDPS